MSWKLSYDEFLHNQCAAITISKSANEVTTKFNMVKNHDRKE